MPNGNTHRLLAALAIGSTSLAFESNKGEITGKPIQNALIAALTTNLPDMIEPGCNPHHRQFFHSMLFGGMVAYASIKLYEWNPVEDREKNLRQLLLVGSCGYLIHLFADSLTPRGLPLIGKV